MNKVLDDHIKRVSDELSYGALVNLSALTRHYNGMIGAPPSPGLLHFFTEPDKEFNFVCLKIYGESGIQLENQLSFSAFEKKFEELLGFIEFQFVKGEWRLVGDASQDQA